MRAVNLVPDLVTGGAVNPVPESVREAAPENVNVAETAMTVEGNAPAQLNSATPSLHLFPTLLLHVDMFVKEATFKFGCDMM